MAEDVRRIISIAPFSSTRTHHTNQPAHQELEIVAAAYSRCNGNISAVARELGISRNTVYKKLKEARSLGASFDAR